MELFMADLAFELKKNERRFLPQNLLFKIAPFWKFQKQCTEVGYKKRSLKNIQNEKWIYLYSCRIYSLVCRYKTHEAGHGNARGRPHILILGNRDADDFRTCQDIDMSEQTTAANLDEAIETQMKQSESA